MRHCAVLDIGSSKAACLIASAEPDGAIVVHGTGVREYSGFRPGELPSKRDLADTVSAAIHSAERAAKVRVREVCVGVPSCFMKTVRSRGSVEILSRSGRVSAADVEELIDSSFDFEPDPEYSLIHSTPVAYVADRTPITGSPVGLPCGVLSAEVSHCYCSKGFISAVEYGLSDIGAAVGAYVSTALASACFAVAEDIRQGGVYLVDCGGTQTDVALLRGNAVVKTATIPMGGRHFTSDLCYGLRLPEGVAEDIKRRYVFSLDYGQTCERIRIPGEGVFDIEHSTIQLILESRADELCELVGDTIAEMGADCPVVLAGSGFASIRGAREFMEGRLGRPVAAAEAALTRANTNAMYAAFSLADFALFRSGRSGVAKRTERLLRRTFDRRS